MKLNSLVSGGKDIQLLIPELGSQIEVVAMNTHLIRIDTKDHQGPLQINIDFIDRFMGDIKCSVHTHAKVGLDSFIWQFMDKKSMNLRPLKAFDAKLLTAKQSKLEFDKNIW